MMDRSKIGRASRAKGAAGEREVVVILKRIGFLDARRGAQYRTGKESPDVDGVPGWWIEVKRRKKKPSASQVCKWYTECKSAAGDRRAVVLYRWDGGQWHAEAGADYNGWAAIWIKYLILKS